MTQAQRRPSRQMSHVSRKSRVNSERSQPIDPNMHKALDFGHSVAQLSDMFQPDNVRNRVSVRKIGDYGGIDKFQQTLKTNFKNGLSSNKQDHEKRIKAFGNNLPITKKPKTVWQLVKDVFVDPMLKLLLGAAIVSTVLGIVKDGIRQGILEGMSIFIAIALIVVTTAGNNYMKEKQFKKLNAMATKKNVNVYRDGNLVNMSVYDLLVGDVVEIETGQILSVDGLLINGHNVSVDESSITGESFQIRKSVPTSYDQNQTANPFLISGSKIMEGTGQMLVLAIGHHSQYGKLKLKIQQQPDETPLQAKLGILVTHVSILGIVAAVFIVIMLKIYYISDCMETGNFSNQYFSMQTINIMIEFFIIAVSTIVMVMPEGLPLAVTIALAFSVGKMKDQNNLVRYLQACETMGGANNICTDKTGTLTENKMAVTKLFMQQTVYTKFSCKTLRDLSRQMLSYSVIGNSNANPTITIKDNKFQSVQIGNKTECALLEMAYKFGYDFKQLRKKENIVRAFPFSSLRKRMTTIFKVGDKVYVFTKGAPEYLIPEVTQFIDRQGKVAKVTTQFSKQLTQTISQFASQSLRTILLAFRQLEPGEQYETVEQYESGLVALGLVGIKDPLRKQIPSAIEKCKGAGITVRMVTGDNKETAIAIAKQAGILDVAWRTGLDNQEYTVMQGKQFREFVGGLVYEGTTQQQIGNLDNFEKVVSQLRVLARSSPDDKYLLATGLKQLGDVVAMTGDGTNDAPALKKADIGFAMGITGTQVAKEASGIILLDDNFNSIVTAVKWGRNIFDAIRKFLQFQLTVNYSALVIAILGGLIYRQSPLNAIQMLWVNLVMDTLASLALATQPPTNQLLLRKPYSRYQSLVTRDMWKNIVFQGTVQVIILVVVLFWGPQIFGVASSVKVSVWNSTTGKHYSMFFNIFVLLQLFNEIHCRKLSCKEHNVFKDFFNNPMFVIILVITFATQFMMIKMGGKAVKTVPLSFEENFLCLLVGSLMLVTGYLSKIVLPEHITVSLRGFEWGRHKVYWNKQEADDEQGSD